MPYKDPIIRSEYLKHYHSIHYDVNKESEKKRIYERRNKIKKWFQEYKKLFYCVYCNSKDNLEFHHIDPKTKFKEISKMVCYGYSIKRIMKEMEKCITLCRKCHMKETWG